MAAHQGAQSVPHPFMAPELPVGSPERTALFKDLRRTFREDWREAEEAVAAKGDLYFIRCGEAVKIGRTSNISQRLANMQVNSPEEMDCLLLLRGRGAEESAWQGQFKADRIRGEWFKLSPALEQAIKDEREALTGRF